MDIICNFYKKLGTYKHTIPDNQVYPRFIFLVCIFLIGHINSCTKVVVNPEEHVDKSLPVPLFDPIPISVVIYYDDEFLSHYISRKTWYGGFQWNVPVGALNTGLFNDIFPMVFEQVTFSRDDPLFTSQGAEYDLVIRPELLKADYEYTDGKTEIYSKWGHQRSSLLLSYSITFLLPNGQNIGSWIIRSYKFLPFGVAYRDESITSSIKALYKLNARGIAAIFMSGFCEKEFISNEFAIQCRNSMQKRL